MLIDRSDFVRWECRRAPIHSIKQGVALCLEQLLGEVSHVVESLTAPLSAPPGCSCLPGRKPRLGQMNGVLTVQTPRTRVWLGDRPDQRLLAQQGAPCPISTIYDQEKIEGNFSHYVQSVQPPFF